MADPACLVRCASAHIATTLAHLRAAGSRNQECVVLWLGRPSAQGITVVDAYRPQQHAASDMFHIPPDSMAALRATLRQHRVMVAAQVHSHPHEAFHSLADNRWAIVRHVGALSLVVPEFAAHTRVDTFLDHTKVFRYSSSSQWREVPAAEVGSTCLQIHCPLAPGARTRLRSLRHWA
ncbi:MAG: Mov34/MPN/PAD-1 family protein [Betaproteobacteria bacterium]|nr:Mov34/MPN/PAD-1 family protein [Betaproteobacteria bacterium]